MKIVFAIVLIFNASMSLAQPFKIAVTVKLLQDQQIYIGHFYGRQLPIIDSVLLDKNGKGVWQPQEKPGDGIYFLSIPGTRFTIPFLIDKNYQFSIHADTAAVSNVSFSTSPENVVYNAYQRSIQQLNRSIQTNLLQLQLKKGDSAMLVQQIYNWNDSIQLLRKHAIKDQPGSLLADILKAMLEPEVPQNSQADNDSSYGYKYVKQHFWDHLKFFDDRMARTPFLESKLDRYFNELVYHQPDSVLKEIDWMMGFATASPFMQKFLLPYFINRYAAQKQVWEDEVFLTLFEKYINDKEYPWMAASYKKALSDRAISIMSTHKGKPAPSFSATDINGNEVSLQQGRSLYTLLVIWDATCGHCKQLLPRLHQMYQQKWKSNGVEVYSLSRESDGTREMWQSVIAEKQLTGWTHVYHSTADDKALIDAGGKGLSRLFDLHRVPTLYLLDENKNIIARKITEQQVDELITRKESK